MGSIVLPAHAQTSTTPPGTDPKDPGCNIVNLPFDFSRANHTYTLSNGVIVTQTVSGLDSASDAGGNLVGRAGTKANLTFSPPIEVLIHHAEASPVFFDGGGTGGPDTFTINAIGGSLAITDPMSTDLNIINSSSDSVNFSAIGGGNPMRVEGWKIETAAIPSLEIIINKANPKSKIRLQTNDCI